jgi:hypothetical protein
MLKQSHASRHSNLNSNPSFSYDQFIVAVKKVKQSQLQAWNGPTDSKGMRLPDFMTIGIWRWKGCQPHAPANFIHQEIFLLLEAESTPHHSAAGRIMSLKNSNDTTGNWIRDLPACSAVSQPAAPPRAASKMYSILHTFSSKWSPPEKI